MPTPPGQPAFDCTIELCEVEPRVWRRAFEIGGDRFGMQFDDYPEDELQEKDFTVVTAVGANERFTYEYDFGDSWDHEITVHRVWQMPKGLKFAVCLDGANACPPEDVGGSWGYEHYLTVLADPTHEEHDHLSGWRGQFDPNAFDLALVNAHLQGVR